MSHHVRLVCVLREPEGLMALAFSEEDAGLRRLPLHALTESEVPGRASLLDAWEYLSRARGATAETLTRVLQVLLATVPGDGTPPRGLEHPWLEPPPAPHRRTAAHPRGYRGTLYQPPKRPRPAVFDIRPHLLHRRTLGALLEPLRPHVKQALRQLEAEGHSRERLERVALALASPTRADVALAYHHGLLEARGAELPASFIRLGVLLARGPERGFSRLLALRGRLAIDTHPAVLTAAARLLSRWGPKHGLSWLEVAARLVPEAQVELLTALVRTGLPPFGAEGYDLQFEPFASHRASWRVEYLRGLAANLSSDYLLSGFRLLAAHGLDDSLETRLPSASGPVPEECLGALFIHLLPETSGHSELASLWSLCGELPGFAEILSSTPWTSLTPAAAYALVKLLNTLGWDDTVERPVRLRWWSVARRILPPLLLRLSHTPASHQQRCVEMVCRLVALGETPWEVPAYLVISTLALAERICGPPFSRENRLSYVLEALVKHPDAQVRERFLAAPERGFLRFDDCCAREDLAILAGMGMEWLVEHDVGLVLDAFESCPETLARTARLRCRWRTSSITTGGRRADCWPATSRESGTSSCSTPSRAPGSSATPGSSGRNGSTMESRSQRWRTCCPPTSGTTEHGSSPHPLAARHEPQASGPKNGFTLVGSHENETGRRGARCPARTVAPGITGLPLRDSTHQHEPRPDAPERPRGSEPHLLRPCTGSRWAAEWHRDGGGARGAQGRARGGHPAPASVRQRGQLRLPVQEGKRLPDIRPRRSHGREYVHANPAGPGGRRGAAMAPHGETPRHSLCPAA